MLRIVSSRLLLLILRTFLFFFYFSPVVTDFNPLRRHHKKKMDQFAETGGMDRRMLSNGPVIKVFVVPENLAPDVIQNINEEVSRGSNRGGGGSNKGSPLFAVGGKVSIG